MQKTFMLNVNVFFNVTIAKIVKLKKLEIQGASHHSF